MTQELHYTSVPRGLRPGSQGFCTVACTPRMSGPMIERLEALSGYQPVYPVHDPAASRNPINFSHLKLSIGAQTVSVLSRVGPARLDYSGRSNKYAHHVVLEASERPQAGPAWLLSQPGFMQATWEGEPREWREDRTPPPGDRPPGVAHAWREILGDAGWAGVLAESFLADPRRPAILVFNPGMDLLPLFVEAIALLPPSRRWDVEFSTYFTTPPRGANCPWRGMIAGSPETESALRLPGALVINLLERRDAEGGALVHQARTGERQESRDRGASAASPHAAPRPTAAGPHNLAAGPPPPGHPLGPTATDPLFPNLSDRPAGRPPRLGDRGRPAPHLPTWALVAGILAACLIPLAALAFFLRGGSDNLPVSEKPSESKPDPHVAIVQADGAPKEKTSIGASHGQRNVSGPERDTRATTKPGDTPKSEVASDDLPDGEPKGLPEGSRGQTSAQPDDERKPPEDADGKAKGVAEGSGNGTEPNTAPIGSKGMNILDRPSTQTKPAVKPATQMKRLTVFLQRAEPKPGPSQWDVPEFASVEGFNLKEAEIKLLGAGSGLRSEPQNEVDGARKLVVSTNLSNGYASSGNKSIVLATFRFLPDAGKIELRWGQEATSEAREQLRDCVLVLSTKEPQEERAIVLRRKPEPDKDGLKMAFLESGKGAKPTYSLRWDVKDEFATTKRKLTIDVCKMVGEKREDFPLIKQDDGSWRDEGNLVTIQFVQSKLKVVFNEDGRRTVKQKIEAKKVQIRAQMAEPDPDETLQAREVRIAKLEEELKGLERLQRIHSSQVNVVISWEVEPGTRYEIARSPGIAAEPVAKPPAH